MPQYEVLEDDDAYESMLNKCMFYAKSFVNKHYLINLNEYPVLDIEDSRKNDDFIRLFHIQRIVYNKEEIANDKLISVYSAVYNIQATCVLIIRNHDNMMDFYLGVRSEDNASTAEAILGKSLQGNFPGSIVEAVPEDDVSNILSSVNESTHFGCRQNVASVSIVPSTRDEDKLKFVQGIEKFIDTMRDKESDYTAMIIAEPVVKENLELRKQGLLSLQTNLSAFESTQLSYGTNSSSSVAKGMSENLSKAINNSISDTNSNYRSSNVSRNRGWSFGILGMGINGGTSHGFCSGSSWAKAVTEGTTVTNGQGTSETHTETTGDTKTITVTNQNKYVQNIDEKIEQHLRRICNCESFGMWDVACYFISENVQTAVVAASTYKALMSGNDSGIENSYVNIWTNQDDDHTPKVLESLRYCINPFFEVPSDSEYFYVNSQYITPCCMVSGNELPIILGLPRKSVQGVTVLDIAEFGRNVMYTSPPKKDAKAIRLGQIFHMGREEGTPVRLILNSFTAHCFICGSTGSGKSNTTYRILDEMIENRIPFLVIEPAKGEYKRYYGGLNGINIYCTNPSYFTMLKVNPFKFPSGIHVLEHLDRLIEIFNACWPLYAAMPAILKDSFEQAYVRCGWDLNKSIHIPTGRSKYPTFQDIMEILPQVINSSAYSSDSKGDYTGSLVTRIKSLTNGIIGQVMCTDDDIDDDDLFDSNTIIDLSRVSSLETKSLLMGVMILKLNEHRMCTSKENQPLRHITVLEEAHNILKRTGGGSVGQESADVQGKSVEMISASIAEMRTYGEGFIIVDQSPTAVDISAIKNTNTKIVMRLPDYDDCMICGRAIGLNEDQIHEISRFPMGVAAVYQNNWSEAVLCKIDKSGEQYHKKDEVVHNNDMADVLGRLATELLTQFDCGYLKDGGNIDIAELQRIVKESAVTDRKKRELNAALARMLLYFEGNPGTVRNFAKQISELVVCEGLFRILPLTFKGDYSRQEIRRDIILREDRRAIIEWYKQVREHLDDYIYLENEALKNKLLYFLLFNERDRDINNNKYKLIMAQLFDRKTK